MMRTALALLVVFQLGVSLLIDDPNDRTSGCKKPEECCRYGYLSEAFNECCLIKGCCPRFCPQYPYDDADNDNDDVDVITSGCHKPQDCCRFGFLTEAFNECCIQKGCCPRFCPQYPDITEGCHEPEECCRFGFLSEAFKECCIGKGCCPVSCPQGCCYNGQTYAPDSVIEQLKDECVDIVCSFKIIHGKPYVLALITPVHLSPQECQELRDGHIKTPVFVTTTLLHTQIPRTCYTVTVTPPWPTQTVTVTSKVTSFQTVSTISCPSSSPITECPVTTVFAFLMYTATKITGTCAAWVTTTTSTRTIFPSCPAYTTVTETVPIRFNIVTTLSCISVHTVTITQPVTTTVRTTPCPSLMLKVTGLTVETELIPTSCPQYNSETTLIASTFVYEGPTCPVWVYTSHTSITTFVNAGPGPACPTRVISSDLTITSTIVVSHILTSFVELP